MKKLIVLLVLVTNILFAVDANLEVVKKSQTLPKVVVNLAQDSSEKDLLTKIEKTFKKDLEVSGHFKVVDLVSQALYDGMPDMINLSNQGVDLYINLSANRENGKYNFKLKLYDINAKVLVFEKSFSTSQEKRYPFLAHRATIKINDFYKAPSVAWMDKFVLFSVYKGARSANIMIGDYTLAYKKTVVSGGLNIFPKWANSDQKSIYFTSYNYNKPTLLKLNIFSQEKRIIMKSDGMIACSDVSDDGKKLLITAAPSGQPDVYLYNTITKSKKRLTKFSDIDVGAQFIENGKRIAFVSNRLGYPNIFAKSINGSGVEKLVFHSKNNSSVTAFDDFIVYSSKEKDNELSSRSFNLYLISTKSDDLKRLTSSGINQFPKFSKDGESLLYIKYYKGKSYVGIIRLNFQTNYLFPLNIGRIQSIDW